MNVHVNRQHDVPGVHITAVPLSKRYARAMKRCTSE